MIAHLARMWSVLSIGKANVRRMTGRRQAAGVVPDPCGRVSMRRRCLFVVVATKDGCPVL